MKINLTLCLVMAVSMSACQTTGGNQSAEEALFQGISAEKRSQELVVERKSEDPVCLRYYANATQVVASSNKKGVGGSLLKTLALGTLAGAASGGVGSLGISSSFVELALAGAANQVVFQGAETVINNPDKAESKQASLMREIEAGAKEIGCPKPQAASADAAKELSTKE